MSLFRTGQPKEMYWLSLTEMCQRFAFWGIANLLVIYLVEQKKFSDLAADHLFGIFTGLAFALPVLGGYLGYRLNYRLPIIWGIYATAIGCFFMATGILSLVYIALFFTAFGTAVFTPNMYTLLGSLYHDKQHLREGGFSIYYSAVNIGILLGMVFIGALGQKGLWTLAFIIAGLIQLPALFFFSKALKGSHFIETAKKTIGKKPVKPPPLHKNEKDRILVICALAFFSIIFWMAYNQGGSSINLFTLRYVDRDIGGFEVPPSWFLSCEVLYLILFSLPLAALYAHLAKKKKNPSPIFKSALSLFAIALFFGTLSLAAKSIQPGAHSALVNPLYLVGAYGFMALGEMLVAPIGLALITHLSPHRFTACLIGIWYL
ncbi:MAG: peptide MFS transporter, partial [Chlamydiales bacterium]|nr:peptide MFS transporter [Chlamydiales bacterium]